MQAHLQNEKKVDCYNWTNICPPSDSSTSSFNTASDTSNPDRAGHENSEDIHNRDIPVALTPFPADGIDNFDVDNLLPMDFTEEELHPRAEPRTQDNHYVKHPTAGAAFGPGLTVLEDIRLNNKFAKEQEGNIFYPFASEMDWEVGSWLSRLNVSMELVDEFFRLEFLRRIYHSV